MSIRDFGLAGSRAASSFGQQLSAGERLQQRINERMMSAQRGTGAGAFLPASRAANLAYQDENERRKREMQQAAGQPVVDPALQPARDDSVTLGSAAKAVASGGLGLAGGFGNILDVPGSVVRDVLTWAPGGIEARNPFDQLLPWNWASSDGRTTEEELLESAGLYDDGPSDQRSTLTNIGRFAGELGLGIALDPLTYVTGGMTAYLKGAGKGAKAARTALKSGLIDRGFAAPNLLAKKAGTEAAGGSKKLGRELGKRESLAEATLDDLVKTTRQGDDIAEAAANAKQSAVNRQLELEVGDLDVAENAKKADEIRKTPLAEEGFFNIGVGIPFTDIGVNKRFFKGEKAKKLARAVDTVGEKARFSKLGVKAAPIFSKPLRDARTVETQKQALEEVEYLKEAGVTARSMMYSPIKKIAESEVLNRNLRNADGELVRTPEEINTLSQAMSDYLEDIGRQGGIVAEGKKSRTFDPSTTGDYRARLKDTNPETAITSYPDAFQQLDELGLLDELDKIKEATAKALDDAQRAGVKIEGLDDPFASYATRVRIPEDGATFNKRAKDRYDPNTEFATQRDSHLRNHPLGTSQLQRMSLDEKYAGVRDPKLRRGSDKREPEMEALKEEFADQYGLRDQGFSDKDVDALWETVSSRSREYVEAGIPLFEQNPATAALRNAEGLYQAAAQARGLKNFLKKIASLDETASMKRIGRDSNVAFDPKQEGGGVVDQTNTATFDFLGEAIFYLDNLDIKRRGGDGIDPDFGLRPVGPKTGPDTFPDDEIVTDKSPVVSPSSPGGEAARQKVETGEVLNVSEEDKARAMELLEQAEPTEEARQLALKLRDGDEESRDILSALVSKEGWEKLLDEVEAAPPKKRATKKKAAKKSGKPDEKVDAQATETEPKATTEKKQYRNAFGRSAKESREIAKGLGIDIKKKGKKKGFKTQKWIEGEIAKKQSGVVDNVAEAAQETVEQAPVTRADKRAANKEASEAQRLERFIKRKQSKTEASPRKRGMEYKIESDPFVEKRRVGMVVNKNLEVPDALKEKAKQANAEYKAETGKSRYFSPYVYMLAVLDEDLDGNMWGEIVRKMKLGEEVDPQLAAVVKQNRPELLGDTPSVSTKKTATGEAKASQPEKMGLNLAESDASKASVPPKPTPPPVRNAGLVDAPQSLADRFAKQADETPTPELSSEEVIAASLEDDLTDAATGKTVTPEQVHSVRQTEPETAAEAAVAKIREQEALNVQQRVDQKLAAANVDKDALAAEIKAAKGQELNNYLKRPEVAKLAKERGVNTKSKVQEKKDLINEALIGKRNRLDSAPAAKAPARKGGLAGMVRKNKRMNQAIEPSKAAMGRAGERIGLAGGSRAASILNSALSDTFEPILGDAAKDVASIVETIRRPGDTMVEVFNSNNPAMQRVKVQLAESGMLNEVMREARSYDVSMRSINTTVSSLQVTEGARETLKAMGIRIPEAIDLGTARAHDYLLQESKRLREAGNNAAADYALATARPLQDSRGNVLGSRFASNYDNPDAVLDLLETLTGNDYLKEYGVNSLDELTDKRPAAFAAIVDELRDELSNSFSQTIDFGTRRPPTQKLYQTMAGYQDMDDGGFFSVPFYDETSKYLDGFAKANAKIDRNALLKNIKAEEAEYLEIDLLFRDSPIKTKQEILDHIAERVPDIEIVNLLKTNNIQFRGYVVPGGDPSTYFEILIKNPPAYKGLEWNGSHWRQSSVGTAEWSPSDLTDSPASKNRDQNILVHLRGNVFTDENGNKILRIQENQSDYWQKYKDAAKPYQKQIRSMDKLEKGMPGSTKEIEELRKKLELGPGELNLESSDEYQKAQAEMRRAINLAGEESGLVQLLNQVVEREGKIRKSVSTDTVEFEEALDDYLEDMEISEGLDLFDEEDVADYTEQFTRKYREENFREYLPGEDFEVPSLADLADPSGYKARMVEAVRSRTGADIDRVVPEVEEAKEMVDVVLGRYGTALFKSIDEIAPRKKPKGVEVDQAAFEQARGMREQLEYLAAVGDVVGKRRQLIQSRMEYDLQERGLLNEAIPGQVSMPGGAPLSHYKSWAQLGMRTAMHVAAKNGLDGFALVDGADIAKAVGGPEDALRKAYEIVRKETDKYVNKIGGQSSSVVNAPVQSVGEVNGVVLRKLEGDGKKKWSAGHTHMNEPLSVVEKTAPSGRVSYQLIADTEIGVETVGTASSLSEATEKLNDFIARSYDEMLQHQEEAEDLAEGPSRNDWTQNANVWIFNDTMKAKILEGQTLFQGRNGHPGNRASITFPSDKVPEQWMESQYMTEITAYDAALPLSYSHEMGHLWRMTLGVKAPEMLVEAERLFGVTNGEWSQYVPHPITGNKAPAEEAFADAFMEWVKAGGKAPDEGWQKMWEGFKSFIQGSFSRVRGTDAERGLTPEMHEFFDNLLGEARYTDASRKTLMDVLDETKYANSRALNLLEDEFGPDQMGAAKDLVYMDRLREVRFKEIEELRKKGVANPEDQVPLVEDKLPEFKKELAKYSDASKIPNKIMGINTKVGQREALDKFKIPEEIAADISRVYGLATRLDDSSGRAQLLKAYDRFTNVFKTNVTAVWPSFHVRNFTSGFVQNALNDIYDPTQTGWSKYTKPYSDAAALQTGQVVPNAGDIKVLRDANDNRVLTDEEATEEIRRLIYLHKVMETQGLHRDQLMAQPSDAGEVIGSRKRAGLFFRKDSLLRTEGRKVAMDRKGEPTNRLRSFNPLEVTGGLRREGQFIGERYGRPIGDIVEGGHRIGGFIALMRQGYDPAEAAKRVRLTHVDYSDLTDAERQIGRRLVPFYSFSKGMGKYLATEIASQPGGKVAQTIRAANISREPDVTTPDYINEGVALPLSVSEDGTRNYLTGLGLMHEAPVALADPIAGLVTGGNLNPQKALFKLGSNLNPMLKTIPETVFNQSMFQEGPSGGRSLDDMDPPLGRALSNVGNTLGLTDRTTPVDTPKLLETVLSNSPASRAINTVRKGFDPRKGLLGKGVNTLTGVSYSSISPAAQDAVLRQRAVEIMKEMGGRSFERSYIPDYELERMDPETRAQAEQWMALMQLLSKRAKERRALDNLQETQTSN